MMKRTFLICTLIFGSLNLNAQDLTNKRGQKILPEAGNKAVGFDVIPFLKYAGNIFYNGSDSTRDFSISYPLTFTGKYVKKNNLGYRVAFRLGLIGITSDSLVPKDGSTNANEKVSNQTKDTRSTIYLSAGCEKRVGLASRIVGIYGIDASLQVNSHKDKYTYGNELNIQNQQDFQIKTVKDGSQVGFGIRGFIGVEYFLAAKLSLSAEYGWGPFIASLGRGTVEKEVVDGNTTKTEIEQTDKSFEFGVDNDINGGIVALTFYF